MRPIPTRLVLTLAAAVALASSRWSAGAAGAAPSPPPSSQVRPQSAGTVTEDPIAGPRVAIWYRGEPAGTPRLDDLVELRALGFTAVAWPASAERGAVALRKMAMQVGMSVHLRAPRPPVDADVRSSPALRADVSVAPALAPVAPALAWRAIAHGTRDLAFDAGERSGQGWRDPSGALLPWVAEARTIARQFEFNGALLRSLGRAMTMTIENTPPPGVEVSLVDADRSWVLIATNASPARARGAARFPRGVPPAPWANLVDGEVMAMLDVNDGPRWSFDLGPGQALVFAIDKPTAQ